MSFSMRAMRGRTTPKAPSTDGEKAAAKADVNAFHDRIERYKLHLEGECEKETCEYRHTE